LDLLLAHGDDGSPVLDRAADPRSAAAAARPVAKQPLAGDLADITANANDLTRQRWAVVAPEGAAGDALLAQVRGLVAARAEDQQADVLTIRLPPLGADETRAWRASEYPALYGEDEARRPRYLLILGDLDQISLDTEQVLSHDGITGRLACATEDGYAAYADKVLAWQRRPSHDRARALFYTVHDGTAATTAGHAKLIEPCRDRCTRTARDKPAAFPAAIAAHGAPSPDPGELLGLAAARHPSVLLSMSHGLGPPRRRRWTPAEAREHQGAMSFGTEGALAARELASQPFLPGGLWIYFACFGAGTPGASAYDHWLTMLAQHGMTELAPLAGALHRPDGAGFVSGLGKAALANPEGPLALLGHMDLAWSYSYEELRVDRSGDPRRITGSNRSLNFFHLITKLVAGERVGAATLALRLQIVAVAAELTAHYDRCKRAGSVEGATPADRLALGNLWMLYQDLLGYSLLGDPAVQLPLTGTAHSAERHNAARSRSAGPDVRDPDATLEQSAGSRRPPRSTVRRLDDIPGNAPDREDRGAPSPRAESGDRAAGVEGDPHRGNVDADAIERLERAVLAVAGGESPGAVAADLGVPRSEIVEAHEIYREAGRAALATLIAQRDAQKGPGR
jgi:hypothetical protein